MFELSTLGFMKFVFIAALLASIACGIIGTLVVVNRFVFLAGGIAHAAYGGVGISIFFGLPLLPSVLVFAALCSQILGYATLKTRHHSDALTGVIWASGMSLGALLINMSPGYHADVMGYLFGSILTVLPKDLIIVGILDFVLIAWVYLFYREILAVSYDPEYAMVSGIKAGIFYRLILFFSAVTVVILMRFVGLILVIALLSIPSYIAESMATSLNKMFIICTTLALFSLTFGLIISTFLNLQPGPTIIIFATLVFISAKIVKLLLIVRKENSKYRQHPQDVD